MNEMCGDNRFEIIAKAKAHLLDATNIDTSEDEMKVLDSFLFRCWQMGWLDRYDMADRKTEPQCNDCKWWEADTGFCYSKADSDDHACHYEPKDEPQKWETPPKFEHKGIITTCVGVPMALIEDEPQTEDERVKDVVRGFMGIVDSMRNPTEEENESVNNYLESISKPTGVNIFDMMDEPQTPYDNCQSCLHWVYDGYWYCECNECRYEPKDGQTE